MAKTKRDEAPPSLALAAKEKMIQRIREIHSLGQRLPMPRVAGSKPVATIHGNVKGSGGVFGQDLLYKARRFASVYTPEEVEGLIDQFRKKKTNLSWSHIIPLLSLDPKKPSDRTLREKLQKKAARFGWKSDRIASELQKKRKNSRQRNTGRPATFATDFASLAAKFAEWTRLLTESRPPRGDDGEDAVDLFARFNSMSDDQFAEQAGAIDQAIDAAEGLRDAIEKRHGELKRLRAKARRIG